MRTLRRDALRQPRLRFITVVAARFVHSPTIRRAVRKPSLFENNLKPMVISGGDRRAGGVTCAISLSFISRPQRRFRTDGTVDFNYPSSLSSSRLNDSSPSIIGCWLLFRPIPRPLTYIRNTKASSTLMLICRKSAEKLIARNLYYGIN